MNEEKKEEIKRLEEKIRYHAKLIDNVSDAIISTDVDFKIMSWNKSAEKIYGWKEDEALGKNVADIIKAEYSLDTNGEDVINQFHENGFWRGEIIQPRKDGTRINILSSVSVIKDNTGKSVGAVAVNRDITDWKMAERNLKESEEKFKFIFMESPIAITLYDSNAKLIDANKACLDLINIPDIESLMGFNLFDDPNLGNDSKERLMRGEPAKFEIQYDFNKVENTLKTGRTDNLYFDALITPIRQNNEKISYYLNQVQNITERKVSELKLRESEKNYREAYNLVNFYKDLFAHDMNNILQGIVSSVDYYSQFKNDPKRIKVLGDVTQVVKKHSKRGADLISKVRKLSKLNENEIILREIEIYDILNKAVDNVVNGFQEKNVNIEIEGLSKDMKIIGNELLIDVFDNILNNAVKYNDNEKETKINIEVSKTQEKDTKYLKFQFKDHGIGVPDERKEKLFKRDYSNDLGRRGMGMGLSLVKKIVDKYDGKIWVEDKMKGDYAKGANFIIILKDANLT